MLRGGPMRMNSSHRARDEGGTAARQPLEREHHERIVARKGDGHAGRQVRTRLLCRFSTWLGRRGVYLEDLFVTQVARGKGVGRRLMTRLAAIAVERGWERIDFQVLD